MCELIKVTEISECFPNKFKPVTGEFILQHAKALSKHCKVYVIVPLRYIPPRELISLNVFKSFFRIIKWFGDLITTKNFSSENLEVIYFGYVSPPRPGYETSETEFLKIFFYKKLRKLLLEINPDVVYCNWLRPWAGLCAGYAQEKNIPVIIDHHEDIPTLKKLFADNHKSFLQTLEKADRIIVHSEINKSDLISENLNLKEIEIVHLGQNFIASEKERDFNFHKLNIICVSHLNEPRKNIDVLLKAASLLRKTTDFKLIIAGDGVLKNGYEMLCEKLGLNDITEFTGMKTQDELDVLYERSDLFILPSFPEAFGVVLIEALAKGLPVITCTGSGGGEELKYLGYPAVLVTPDSETELSEAILKLVNDKPKMHSMSVTGKEIVKNNFTWEKNGISTFKILEKTIAESKK